MQRDDTPSGDQLAPVRRALVADPQHIERHPPRYPPGGVAPFKAYQRAGAVTLPRDVPPLAVDLGVVLERRASLYEYAQGSLALSQLGALLHHACGVRAYVRAYGVQRFPLRRAPSAGGLQPVNVYVAANRLAGAGAGVFYYHPGEHALVPVCQGDQRAQLINCCMGQPFVGSAPVTLILSCSLDRCVWKYGARHYRTVHVDTGVLAQNLYLVATALGLGGCAVAGFFDEQINALLGLIGTDEFVTLLFALGRPSEREEGQNG